MNVFVQAIGEIFADPNLATTARYRPDAGAEEVVVGVIPSSPREVSDVGLAGIAAYNRSVLVRTSEVANPDSGTFTGIADFGAATVFRVVEATLDATGAVWTCRLLPTAT